MNRLSTALTKTKTKTKTKLALCAYLLVSQAHAAQIVLIADSANIEARSEVVARLRAEATAAQIKKTNTAGPLNSEYAEALELSLSDLRVALPEVIEGIAKLKGADLVLEPSIAKKFALVGVDISAEVAHALDIRSAKTRFLAP